ncbi:MAG: CHAP domain-containing protein [Myxococcaceae bacterium]|nr:CHAP domain-containing protein [Myxococcaceae bacterium]
MRPLWWLMTFALCLAGCGDDALDEPEHDELPGDVAVNDHQALSSAPPCGTALGTFDGTTAFSNGLYTGRGVSCGGVGPSGYRYQCVELVMRHSLRKWGFRWYGNAKDLLRNAPASKVQVFENADAAHPPVPGDALVWTRGTYGHVALVTAVGGGKVEILEQNWGRGRLSLPYVNGRVGGRPDAPAWVPAGWAHVRANAQPVVNWSCANSQLGNQQLWTCGPSGERARYRCEQGVPVREECPSSCSVKPLGTHDVCL